MKAKMLSKSLFVMFLGLSVLYTGCSKARKAGGEMDSPEVHYKQGMKYFNNHEVKKAEEEFNLAQSLDKKYAPAYAGLALTSAEFAKKNKSKEFAKKAEGYMSKAKGLDKKDPAIWIAHGRMIVILQSTNRKNKKWCKKAVKQFNKAIELDPKNGEAYFRRAMAYRFALRFADAKADFGKVLDLKNGYVAEADKQWKIMQDIERSARSENGKKIALVEKITRADICVLFIDEINITKYIKKRNPATPDLSFKAAPTADTKMETETITKMLPAVDIEGYWAKNFILDVMALGIRGLTPSPDHKFYPDSLVNRGEFALMLEDIIVAMTKEDIKTKYIGGPNRFKDVPPSHPYYNAMCNAVDRGYMKMDVNGFVNPLGSVSGPDALLIMRELRNLDKNFE